MTPTTDTTPTEPLEPPTPRSIKPPEALDPVLLLAEEVKEFREEQSRTNKAQEKRLDALTALVREEGTARRSAEQKLSEQLGAVAQGLLTLGQRGAADKAELLAAIEKLDARQIDQEASLLVADAARTKQDSIHEERLSVADQKIESVKQKLGRVETAKRIAVDVSKAVAKAASPVLVWELVKLLKGLH
jgi:thioesterase domain-containing protein